MSNNNYTILTISFIIPTFYLEESKSKMVLERIEKYIYPRSNSSNMMFMSKTTENDNGWFYDIHTTDSMHIAELNKLLNVLEDCIGVTIHSRQYGMEKYIRNYKKFQENKPTVGVQ